MRTVNTDLVEQYARDIEPLLPLARRAYGTQGPGSAARNASDEVNRLILEYVDEKGGNVTHLANALEDKISLAGIRRRLRVARSGQELGTPMSSTGRKRGSKDPDKVASAARKINNARNIGSEAYGRAVREAYDNNISLSAVAEELGISYFALWSAARTGVSAGVA